MRFSGYAIDIGTTAEEESAASDARACNNLGVIANIRGDREHALTMYARAIEAHQQLGDARALACVHHNIAVTYRQIGMLDRAEDQERWAEELAASAEAPDIVALTQLGRAEIALSRGDATAAEAEASTVAARFAELDDPVQRAAALRVVGTARTARGAFRGAASAIEEGLSLARVNNVPLLEAELLRARAELRVWIDERAGAREDARLAIRLFDRAEAADDRARLMRWLDALERDATPPLGASAVQATPG